VAAAEFKL